MKARFLLVVALAAIVLLLVLAGCHKPTDPDEGDPIVADETVVLPQTVAESILEVSDDQIVLPAGTSPSIYQTGNVIVSGISDAAPNGLLRKVESSSTQNGQIVVNTTQARLVDAFDQLDFETTQSLKTTDLLSSTVLSDGVTYEQDSKNPYNFHYDIDEDFNLGSNVAMNIDGELDLTLGYEFKVKISLLQGLHYIKAGSFVTTNGDLGLTVNGSFDYERSIDLIEHNFAPVAFVVPSVPTVPIILVPKVVIVLNIDASGQASVTTSVSASASIEAGLIYQKPDWTSYQERDIDFEYNPPVLTASMEATVDAGPRFEINLYGIAGPWAHGRGFLTLNADVNSTPWWTLTGGYVVDAGVHFSVLDYQQSYTIPNIINYSTILAQAAQNQVATPTFSPPGGTYNSAQNVQISCTTSGAAIHYTTNGAEPTLSSPTYSNPINVSSTTTIKAKGFKDGWTPSATASATYTITSPNTVATPTFSPPGGTYSATQSVSISCTTSGAAIHYTTNGSEPTASSPTYSSPISVATTTTLKAKGFKDGWTPSATASATYTISGGTPGQMIHVPGGTFTMGRTTGSGQSNELPTHTVTLNSYYIGKYEVTQAEYSQYAQPGSNWTSSYGLGDNYPAYYVSWYAILKYCNLRSMAEGLTPVYSISGSTNPTNWGSVPTSNNSTWNAAICNWNANGYRLPTEAEWEYAARGATNNPDYLYSGSDDINAVAWYSGNNSPNGSKPVGTKAPNGIGTYDMSGNVWEWCWDWYSSSYYSSSPSNNPTGPNSGSLRVSRGGYWGNSANYCRVAYRGSDSPYFSYYLIGFRVCRAVP